MSIWLMIIATVPLLGVLAFVASDLRAVEEVRNQAQQVDVQAQRLVLLNEYRAALLDERNWTAAAAGLDELGLDDAVLTELLGVSISDQAEESIRKVDELAAAIGDDGVVRTIAEVRASTVDPFADLGRQYTDFEAQIATQAQREVDELLVMAGEIGGGAGLIDVLRVLESATLARQAVTSMVSEYFSLQFAEAAAVETVPDVLVEQRELYGIATSLIARVADPTSATAAVLADLRVDEDTTAFNAAAAAMIERLLDARPLEGDAIQAGQDPSAALPELSRLFRAGIASSAAHLELVAAAGEDVTAITAAIRSEADGDLESALTRLALVATITLACTVALGRIIARPLRKLAVAAARLRDGDTSATIEPSGPSEVREAAEAIREAAGHLALAERQANALAQGSFDHYVLGLTAPGALGESLQDAVRTLADTLSDREEFRRLLAHEATHDPLTQLANRRAVMARLTESLARARRNDGQVAVMFVDLDDFKAVNDRHGHLSGDTLLRTLSQRLQRAVREGDHIGRLGGDEFLVVAEPVSGLDDAMLLANRLIDTVTEPMMIDDETITISASVGIALVDASSTLTADEVLRDADLAVYQAKANGGARIALCDDELRADLERRNLLDEAIRAAIDGDQLVLHYQPIVDPSSGSTFALEALVRWDHPSDGMIGPDGFVPFAERSSLIVDLDRWVLRRAIEQLAEWSDHPTLGSVPVSVNISGRHLTAEGFIPNVLEPLRNRGVAPERLIIEVTESALLDDLAVAAQRLQRLRELGVRIAIDDFGTGYTSLAHLRTLPVDILKIDRSFTSDPNAASLVQLIIDTGHLLGARITAEGVETLDQATALTRMGADELQGYLYARPSPPNELAARSAAAS